MFASLALLALGASAVAAQGAGAGYPPPSPVLLTMTKSGVLPVIPTETPFTGVETEEGAIIDQGPINPSFLPVLGPATTATGLPAATYRATLPSTNFDDGTGMTVTGSITISSDSQNPGVMVSANFQGFASAYAPFLYHIHDMPVPADGNCSATMGHLDPTNRGEYYPCNTAAPATCQVGDLAGKHGMIMGGTFTATYADYFLSTDASSAAYFGDKSIVIHSMNTTRITCANFEQVSSGSGSSGGGGGGATPSPTPSAASTGAPAQYTGAAASRAASGIGAAGVLAVAAAFVL